MSHSFQYENKINSQAQKQDGLDKEIYNYHETHLHWFINQAP
jgi:hypothetical protein